MKIPENERNAAAREIKAAQEKLDRIRAMCSPAVMLEIAEAIVVDEFIRYLSGEER